MSNWPTLTKIEQQVLVALNQASKRGELGHANTIAVEIDAHPDAVSSALKRLVDLGLAEKPLH